MQLKKIFRAPLALALVSALAAGCSTSQPERSQRTLTDLQHLSKLLIAGEEQITTLNKALLAISKAKATDMRDVYTAFNFEFQRTQKLAAKVSEQVEDLRGNAEIYFDTWKKQANRLGNADLKNMSLERQRLVQQDFVNVMTAVNAMSGLGKQYGADLTDLQTFLGNDLTRAGSTPAKPFVKKICASSEPFLDALRTAHDEVHNLATSLQPQ